MVVPSSEEAEYILVEVLSSEEAEVWIVSVKPEPHTNLLLPSCLWLYDSLLNLLEKVLVPLWLRQQEEVRGL